MHRLSWLVLLGAVAGCRFELDRTLAAGELRGRAVLALADGTQAPAVGALVRLERSAITVKTDAQGRFDLRGLPGGTLTLTLSHDADGDGAPDSGLRIADVDNGQLGGNGRDLGTIVLARLGAVEATVHVPTGPVAGAQVAIDGVRAAIADDAGHVRFDGLVPTLGGGAYRITALVKDGEGTRGAHADVAISPGETRKVELAIEPALLPAGSVTGRVRLVGDASPGGTKISLEDATGGSLDAETQPEGDFSEAGVLPGIYTIVAQRKDFAPVSVPFVVVAGDSTSVGELVLPRAAADCGLGASDTDGDGFGDPCDVCPDVRDDQSDRDHDGIGDACTHVTPNPDDTTPPLAAEHVPSTDATNVALDTVISIQFSETLATASATTATVQLLDAQLHAVPATPRVLTNELVLTPAAPLLDSTTYTVVLTTGLTDVAGNHLADEVRWHFTTVDRTAPSVVSHEPESGAHVPVDAVITFRLSEPVDPGSVELDVLPADSSFPVFGAVDVTGAVVRFTPNAALAYGTTYRALLAQATDLAGNALVQGLEFSFGTEEAPDTTPPTLTEVAPTDGAVDVLVTADVVAFFSEPVLQASVSETTFFVEDHGTKVAGTRSAQGTSVTFHPASPLPFGTQLSATIAGVTDAAGNPLSQGLRWTFTTACTACQAPETCGGGGVPGKCGCTAQQVDVCARDGLQCGTVAATDSCGVTRSTDCGTCAAGSCVQNKCLCQAETNVEFCQRLGADCGSVTATDNCGVQRTVSCTSGTNGCWYPELCGGAGVANQCGITNKAVPEWPLPTGESLNAMHAAGAGDVWAVGNAGVILRHDGSAWRSVPSGTGLPLNAVWQIAPGDAWAAGNAGRLLHWNGTKWARAVAPVSTNLKAVWGAASDDVWAAGEGGVMLHWNGTRWSIVALTETTDFYAIRGTSRSDVVAVAQGGSAWAWDGSSWTQTTPPSGLRRLWVAPDGTLWGAAAANNVYRRVGGTWTQVPGTPTGFTIAGLWGTSNSDVFLSGTNFLTTVPAVYHYDGSTWTQLPALARIAGSDLGGLSGSDFWLVGEYGLLSHWNGSAWSASPSPGNVQAIWGDPASGSAIAVGSKGLVLRRSAGVWTKVDNAVTDELYGIAPLGDGRFLVGGDNGTVAILDGTTVTPLPAGGMGRTHVFLVNTASDFLALGETGVVQRWNGTSWTTLSPASTASPTGGDSCLGAFGTPAFAWTSSQSGKIRRWDGTAPTVVYANASLFPFSAMWGSSPSDVWTAGYITMHYDGTTWSQVPMPTTKSATGYDFTWAIAAGGNGAGDVWLSNSSAVFHRVGSGWQWSWAGTTEPVRAIAGVGGGQVVVGGGSSGHGTVVRLGP